MLKVDILLVFILQTTFTIGLSYLPLANIGLSALEYWCKHLPASVLEPYYSEFLPCLDAYLKTDNRGKKKFFFIMPIVFK